MTATLVQAKENLTINERGYFEMPGLNVTVFADIYPDGHQTGVTVIQHGVRTAANGDVRLETSPGQWSPVPRGVEDAVIDIKGQRISQTMAYPDPTKNRTGFNPIDYPDLDFSYKVNVTALTANRFKISVDLQEPLPTEWVGKIGFNFELFPGDLFGQAYLMDKEAGIFPMQANGPLINHHGEILAAPLAVGKQLVVAPELDKQRMLIESIKGGKLELWDGRANHNNGWYIVRSIIPAGVTKNAIEWIVAPNVIKGWRYEPVLQVSQLGYAETQPKKLVIEQDINDTKIDLVEVYQLTTTGKKLVRSGKPKQWGNFLRYNYLTYDFSDLTAPGMYLINYRDKKSNPFKIGNDVFSRHAWQPTLEYFLPVQMCHMRVNEKYRTWHGLDHLDDALMAPINLNHFDGYLSGPTTLTKFQPGERVPGLNAGGWHDAGDYDLRVESQIGTVWRLAMMVEEFGLDYDATTIDQARKLVEIHQPDGKNDALQQIEHGLLSILGGYRAMGRLYRGIIAPTLPQYVLLGDASVQTDNFDYDKNLQPGEIKLGKSGSPDDRWVFTEDNPNREIDVAAGLAAASRVLVDYDLALSKEALATAQKLFDTSFSRTTQPNVKALVLAELILATGDKKYIAALIAMQDELTEHIADTGWAIGRVMNRIDDKNFVTAISAAVAEYQIGLRAAAKTESPYGVPYKPNIWGAGWTIQDFGVKQYFFYKAWPKLVSEDFYLNALNFILGVHPGENIESFASGVGSKSATVAYGVNRADWSNIPGGVISGTALIRPDLPELKVWPFFWQQTEYVMGGGATNYMFLAMAADARARSQ